MIEILTISRVTQKPEPERTQYNTRVERQLAHDRSDKTPLSVLKPIPFDFGYVLLQAVQLDSQTTCTDVPEFDRLSCFAFNTPGGEFIPPT